MIDRALIQLEGESNEAYARRCRHFDPKEAARLTLRQAGFEGQKGERFGEGVGTQHAIYMLHQVLTGDMSIGKMNRWLGWAQCLMAVYGHLTLEQMKDINRLAA